MILEDRFLAPNEEEKEEKKKKEVHSQIGIILKKSPWFPRRINAVLLVILFTPPKKKPHFNYNRNMVLQT